MLKNNLKYTLFVLLFIFIGCAKRGSITGGLKDTIAPVLKTSFPKNFSTNFKGNEIKLVFDENIKLKNLNKQLIISPPMKNEPLIYPTTASKTISIKIKDSLRPNTTYSFNFGQSIADNNEGNTYNQFKYVFSTGAYIDSLSLKGTIKSAYDRDPESFVSVMLYEVNDAFQDSIVYKQNPSYITNTLDSSRTFGLENLKSGKYLLVALKDHNNNTKYNPKTEKIGFHKEFITIPTDTLYTLQLFKEEAPFKALKPTQVSGSRLIMGYEGEGSSVENRPKIMVKNNNQILPTLITQLPKRDSIQIWFKPIKTDSLSVAVTKDSYQKDFFIKIKNQKKDTLSILAPYNGTLHFRNRFVLETATPLVGIDNSKIKLSKKDGDLVTFTTEYDSYNQKLFLDFKKEPLEKYTFSILPGALTDFLGQSNDTLTYKSATKNTSDYGNLSIKLENAKRFPLLIELTDAKGVVLASQYLENNTNIDFNLLEPASFVLRAIYDDNKNRRYDAGNFLEKRYSEEVIYFSKEIDVRANWDVEQIFDLALPYLPDTGQKIKKIEKQSKI